ncbi:DUF4097 family beta strand repeat-containing protein [Enterocloster sp. OA13]|uniref:DUF4097 family beta strand repeat-containing protein n=1 Tax=Enterocloster TaxID=2719313 RepID=UPI000197A32F|nr:DUF4097 family beta strand repeat-containing protein [Lachnoclostridium pacaense]EEQ60605.1 hypothetical protein CBFG_04317 [Clostridiales bacterium 1_7_47FAA]MCC2875257.1 DUF4097 family beta strand repeat-containing protein [Lachnoclostridium pacaense]MCH1952657.1 DUF4097 family beta strand repeat-containing protein [Enterocloster sp. OA13]RJW39858.1 hypothetical protein DXC92_17020 [Clostridiales bacterium TF09-2AC]
MKRFIKICALTGLILLLAGIGITSVSAALGGRYSSYLPRRIWSMVWDDDDYMDHGWNDDFSDTWNSGKGWVSWTEDTLRPDGNHDQDPGAFSSTRKLDIDVDKCILRVYEKEDISQIEVNVNDKYNATQCYMDKDTLKIKREQKHRRGEDIRIEVLVPTDYEFDKISVDIGAAECQFSQIHTNKLDIDTGVGAVTFTGTVAGDVELETGVGDVTLNLANPEQDYNYRIECGVGTIRVGGSSYTMLSHETHINNNAPYNMELECGVGSITVNFSDSV